MKIFDKNSACNGSSKICNQQNMFGKAYFVSIVDVAFPITVSFAIKIRCNGSTIIVSRTIQVQGR